MFAFQTELLLRERLSRWKQSCARAMVSKVSFNSHEYITAMFGSVRRGTRLIHGMVLTAFSSPPTRAQPPKTKGAGKKAAKVRTPTLIDGLTKEEMSKEQVSKGTFYRSIINDQN